MYGRKIRFSCEYYIIQGVLEFDAMYLFLCYMKYFQIFNFDTICIFQKCAIVCARFCKDWFI